MGEMTPISTDENSQDQVPDTPLRGVRDLFVGPHAVDIWAGISMFVVGALIISASLWS